MEMICQNHQIADRQSIQNDSKVSENHIILTEKKKPNLLCLAIVTNLKTLEFYLFQKREKKTDKCLSIIT